MGVRKLEDREDFYDYKRFAIRAAKELEYSDEVIDSLKASKNDHEIARIMKTARERSFVD